MPTPARLVPPTTAASAPVQRDPARARRHLLGLYALLGITIASWLARLPSVRAALDLSSADLGRVLLVGALGSLASVLAAGSLVGRWGSRRTLLAAAVMYAGAAVLLGVGPSVGSVVALTLGVMLMSASFATSAVAMNVEAGNVERALARTVVPQFHAAFSVGSVVGSLLGAAAAWAQVPLLVQFGAVGLLSLVWRFRSVPAAVLPPDPAAVAAAERDTRPAPPRRGSALGAWRERRTLLIGLVVMTAALSEGAANNWLAIAVVDGFAQTEAVAAVVFGIFVASMTVSRLLGTWIIDRYGRVAVLAASGTTSFCGLLLFGLAPNLPLAAVGVVAWGLGAGLVVPIGLAAVAHDGLRAAARVSVVSAFASVASIAAPPLLGMAAEAVGARTALLAVAVALAASVALAGTVRPPQERARAGSADAVVLPRPVVRAEPVDVTDARRPAPAPAPAPVPVRAAEPELVR